MVGDGGCAVEEGGAVDEGEARAERGGRQRCEGAVEAAESEASRRRRTPALPRHLCKTHPRLSAQGREALRPPCSVGDPAGHDVVQ